jgi:plastocyanin
MPTLRLLAVPAALCLFAACSSDSTGSSNSAPPPPTANATTDINIPAGASTSGLPFQPNPKTVALNGGASVSIRWVNRDYSGTDYSSTTVAHHIVSDNNPAAFAPSQVLTATAPSYTISLSAPGDYPYHCSIHPTTMHGTIHVDP